MESMAETADGFLARQRPLVDQTRRTLEESGIEVVIAGASDLNGIFRGKRVPAARFVEHPLNPVHVSDYFWAMDIEELVMPREPGTRAGGRRGTRLRRRAPDPRPRHAAHRTVARQDRRRALRALLPRRLAGRDRSAAAAPPPRRPGGGARPDPEVRSRARVLPVQGRARRASRKAATARRPSSP